MTWKHMLKFIAGFLTAFLIISLYLSTVTIPEYIIKFDCQEKREPALPSSRGLHT